MNKLLKFGCLGIIVFLAVLWIVGTMNGGNTSTPTRALVASGTPTALPKPTAAIAATPIPLPTEPPSTPVPEPLKVINTGADGLSIRKAPGDGERIKAWPDGTILLYLNDRTQAAGRAWAKVRDPDGNEGWVANEFLLGAPVVLKPTAPVPVATRAPAVAIKPGADPDYSAITTCEKYVRDRLKAPSTAKYSGWGDSVTVTRLDGTTIVRAYVDAQNSFGAVLRNNYICTLGPSSTLTRPLLDLTGI